MTIERGIIASPGLLRRLPAGFEFERALSLEEIAFYTLYWQKLVIPRNNLVNIELPHEEDLISCGVLERPRVIFAGRFQGDMFIEAFLSCQGIVAKDLAKDRSVDWVIHQAGRDLCIQSEYIDKRDLLRFDLINALPVPAEGTPLHEVLEFREQRKGELGELHTLLDELYINILKSPDQELATKQEVSRLLHLIADLDRVSKEKFKKTRKYDLSTSVNLGFERIATGAAAGAIFDIYASGLTFPLATVIGALAPILKIEAKASYSFEPAKNNLKLSYLSHASSLEII